MKRPSFQFYPADWRKDAALQSCSLAARGLWIDVMCVMHECEPYGHLIVNGNAMRPAQVARLVGIGAQECVSLLNELEQSGVLSRTGEGAIFSRRMVKDERLRNARAEWGRAGAEHGKKGAEYGAKGGRPRNDKGGLEPAFSGGSKGGFETRVEPPPSSSSSSSSSKLKTNSSTSSTVPPGFAAFWQAYPATRRRVAKRSCLAKWNALGCEAKATEIADHVRAMAATEQWRGGYEPAPLTYLGQRRWEDGLPAAPTPQRQERRLALD